MGPILDTRTQPCACICAAILPQHTERLTRNNEKQTLHITTQPKNLPNIYDTHEVSTLFCSTVNFRKYEDNLFMRIA